MASLYSAQAVITAREQLNQELEEKSHSNHSIEDPHKSDKPSNPYHYHQTVHEKCKHHPEYKESMLHKKIHNQIEQTKSREEHEGEQQHHGSSGRSFRRVMREREEVEEEMKGWAKTIQKCLKGEHKLSQKELHQQHAGFYKWMLFIEELFRNYEGSLKTQTSLHALEQEEHKSDKFLERSQGILESPKSQHKVKETHGVKLPQIAGKERLENVQSRVHELEKQLDVSQANNRDISKRLKDLTLSTGQSQEKYKVRWDRFKKTETSIKALLGQMQQFNSHLLTDLKEPEKLKQNYPKLIQSNLKKIKELKESLKIGEA